MILNHREVPDHPTHERSRLAGFRLLGTSELSGSDVALSWMNW